MTNGKLVLNPTQLEPLQEYFRMQVCILLLFGSYHAQTCLRASADSKGPDRSAHPHSLIRAFAARKQNHWKQWSVSMENPDENFESAHFAHARRLFYA